eukprot:668247-Rhodomonas_salina.2
MTAQRCPTLPAFPDPQALSLSQTRPLPHLRVGVCACNARSYRPQCCEDLKKISTARASNRSTT